MKTVQVLIGLANLTFGILLLFLWENTTELAHEMSKVFIAEGSLFIILIIFKKRKI